MNEEIKLEVVSSVDTKEIETALETTKKVDEAVVEKSLNYDVLTDEEKKAIDTFLEKIDVKNTTQILQFGASAQNNISKFSDTVLQDVRTRSTGEVGGLLSNLVGEIKEFEVLSMNNGKLTFKSDDIVSFALLSSNTPNQPDDSSKDNSINNSVVNTGDYNYSFAYILIISAIAVIVLSVLRRKKLEKD